MSEFSSQDKVFRGKNPWLASFGRRRGRKLAPQKTSLVETLLPALAVELDAGACKRMLSAYKTVWLEIGFGGGEHIAAQAARHPDILCIGCEPYLDGVASLLTHIHAEKLQNIRVLNDDMRLLLEKLPDACLDRVFILFPDPWPKARHHKRRIVSLPTLEMLARVMKPGAELRLATDHVDYSVWMLEHALASPHFSWTAQSQADWKNPPVDWVPTRYEQKTRAEGRAPVFYSFIRK